MKGDRHWRRLELSRVLVNLKPPTDHAIRGLIRNANAAHLELVEVEVIVGGRMESPARADGSAIIPIERIDWIQRLSAPE